MHECACVQVFLIKLTVSVISSLIIIFWSKLSYKIIVAGGVVIGSVNATDMDLPPTLLRYSIVSGGGAGGLRNIFHLDPMQGQITLLTHPDYEDIQTHVLIIRVVDGDPIRPRSATTTVSAQ